MREDYQERSSRLVLFLKLGAFTSSSFFRHTSTLSFWSVTS